MTEAELQEQVADYLRLQYPEAIFRSDFGSGTKLTWAQAKRQKRQNGGRRAWPDMLIAEPRLVVTDDMPDYMHGLFIELKRPGVKLYKKNGELVADQHIREQAEMLQRLRQRGYKAEFACGFDEAKKLIDEYLR